MPELPEVETIRRDLARVLPGKIIKDIEVRSEKFLYYLPAECGTQIINPADGGVKSLKWLHCSVNHFC